jgi:hypothetical protein
MLMLVRARLPAVDQDEPVVVVGPASMVRISSAPPPETPSTMSPNCSVLG